MSIREQLAEAVSKKVGKTGKWKYQGKVGVWRTTDAGDHIFIPDGGGKPMAMNKHTTKHAAKGMSKKKGGARGRLKKLLKAPVGGQSAAAMRSGKKKRR